MKRKCLRQRSERAGFTPPLWDPYTTTMRTIDASAKREQEHRVEPFDLLETNSASHG
jgi:hypothetical protein